MQNITKVFPGVIANDHINFDLQEGEIHALLGENGAGKSTLMSVLFGLYNPEEGTISKFGQPLRIRNPNDANEAGIGMVHQHFKLVDVFTVLDNILLGAEPMQGLLIRRKQARKEIEQLSKKYNLQVDLDAYIEDISVGMQQRVEILKMLYRNNNILIFDEPTAVLTPQETDELIKILKSLKAEGKSILFISHKLNEIMAVSDRVTVLRKGKSVKTLNTKDTNPKELSLYMVGRELVTDLSKKPLKPNPKPLLELQHITYKTRSKKHSLIDVSLAVHEGEIVGVAGIEGNGQSELAYVISGLVPIQQGTLKILGKDMTRASIRSRNDLGLAHVPEDRHKYGLVLDQSLEQNLVLKKYHQSPFQKQGFIQTKPIREQAEKLIQQFDVRSGRGATSHTGSLSGGNQQKAIVAREIDTQSPILLAVQLTRGLDVGAIENIHQHMIRQRDEGKGILLISLELDEIFKMSDRILVMYEGQIVGEFNPKHVTKEEIGLYMSGAKHQ